MPSVRFRSLKFLGYDGYQIGTDGSAWTCIKTRGRGTHKGKGVVAYKSKTWRKLKPVPRSRKTSDPYYYVNLSSGGIAKLWGIHVLVLLAFVGQRPPGMEACHFPDRNRKNNQLGNLRWGTKKENRNHAIIHGTLARGESHGMCRASDEVVAEIRRLWESNPDKSSRRKEWSYRKLAHKFQLSLSQTARIIRGESRD